MLQKLKLFRAAAAEMLKPRKALALHNLKLFGRAAVETVKTPKTAVVALTNAVIAAGGIGTVSAFKNKPESPEALICCGMLVAGIAVLERTMDIYFGLKRQDNGNCLAPN